MNSKTLKRKLGDAGLDVSNSKSNESFCLIGTPLPSLDKVKDKNEFVPLWKQEVRDEKGRRRLHGAFTGGFSAGYFNTVGSKDGWAPSTFTSSRNSRATYSSRPEDFMDDEDLADRRETQNMVDETEEMDLTGASSSVQADTDSPDVARILESSMLPPSQDSVGSKILKKMGWKLGQGIGPRVTLKQRRIQDGLAPSTEEEDDEASKHLYPRRDTPLVISQRKDNSHGIGFRPGIGLHDKAGAKKSLQPTISAGFGLGALNDAEDDDVDVYDISSRANQSVAYDIDRGDDDDDETISIGNKAKKSSTRSLAPKFTQTFHDGTVVLSGFVLGDTTVKDTRWFPLPDIPKGWNADPRAVWDKENHPSSTTSTSTQMRKTASERGEILGEVALPTKSRSVFEYISQKDRERLEAAAKSGSAETTVAKAPDQMSKSEDIRLSTDKLSIPPLDQSTARAALQGFQPFVNDMVKHARYTAYLNSQGEPSIYRPPAPSKGQSVLEYNKEMEDFRKSAQLFKPISATMAGRFTSAASLDLGPQAVEGLHTPSQNDETHVTVAKDETSDAVTKIEEDNPKANAARIGMYGQLTRETSSWLPVKLLCKRFGLREPKVDALEDKQHEVPASEGSAPEPSHVPELLGTESFFNGPPTVKENVAKNTNNIGLGEDESQGRDTLTYERPSMDIFKAIFASDAEESDEEQPEPNEPPSISLPSKTDDSSAEFKPKFQSKPTSTKITKKEKKTKKVAEASLISFNEDEDDSLSLSISIKRPKKRKKEKDISDLPAMDVDTAPSPVDKSDTPILPERRRATAADFM